MANVNSFRELERVMHERRADAEKAWREATKEATDTLFKESRDNMRRQVYNKPIPRVKRVRGKDAGKTVKKWRRTGNLRRSEKRRIANQYEGRIWNDAGYAVPRHNLGLGAGDPRAVDPPPSTRRNSERIAPWRVDAINSTKRKRLMIYRRRLFDALRT